MLGGRAARPQLCRGVVAAFVDIDALQDAPSGHGVLMLGEELFQPIDEGAREGVFAWRSCGLVDWTSAEQLELLRLWFSRLLGHVAGVAGVENGQDVALDLVVFQLLLNLVPVGCSISAEPFAYRGIHASRQLQVFLVFLENSVASVVYDEQIMRAVVVSDEVADVAVQLMLRLLPNIELDHLG